MSTRIGKAFMKWTRFCINEVLLIQHGEFRFHDHSCLVDFFHFFFVASRSPGSSDSLIRGHMKCDFWPKYMRYSGIEEVTLEIETTQWASQCKQQNQKNQDFRWPQLPQLLGGSGWEPLHWAASWHLAANGTILRDHQVRVIDPGPGGDVDILQKFDCRYTQFSVEGTAKFVY